MNILTCAAGIFNGMELILPPDVTLISKGGIMKICEDSNTVDYFIVYFLGTTPCIFPPPPHLPPFFDNSPILLDGIYCLLSHLRQLPESPRLVSLLCAAPSTVSWALTI